MAPVAYYAMGGGLGHLVRARAVLATLGLEGDGHVLSASIHARDPRILGPLAAHVPPKECAVTPEALAQWLERTLHELAAETVFVDVFPGGLLGELSRPLWKPGTKLCYVGRLLRWPEYQTRLRAPLANFDMAYLVEPLHPDHQAAMAAVCGQVEELRLQDPPTPLPPPLPDDTWVVLHSGPREEVAELLAYGRDIQSSEGVDAELRVVGPAGAESGSHPWLPEFPAAGYFQQATRVITACGFNVMRQSLGARARHHFMPFARPLDDQFTRAERRRINEQRRTF